MKKKPLVLAITLIAIINVIVTFLSVAPARADSYGPWPKAKSTPSFTKPSFLLRNDAIKQITGTVTDNKGVPLVGVSVTERNTQKMTLTNEKGTYRVQVNDDNAVLVFNYIGFVKKTEVVGSRTVINVVLEESSQELSEVIVTSLGIKKESKKLGYSATTVKVDELDNSPTTNVMTGLEGKVAGLVISPPSSGAGASNKIRLRGQAAFSGADNAPLIVINGLPMSQGARGADGNNSIDLGDDLQQINPDDIESMTVLKGSTAAALYGSRAANGAIIITTKSGSKNSKFGVEFISTFTADKALDYTHFQNEYGQGQAGNRPTTQGNATTTGQFGWGAKYDGVPTIQFDGVLRPYSYQPNRISQFYRTAYSNTNTIAFSGGNQSANYRFSYSDQDAKGITPNNEYYKKIFNVGINTQVTDKLSVQFNLNYTNEFNDNPPQVGVQGYGAPNFLYRMSNTIPLDAFKNSAVAPNGTEMQTSGFQTTLINPYFLMPRQFIRDKRDRFLGTVSARYDFFKWLYLQGRVNMDYGDDLFENNVPTGVGTSTPLNGAGTGYNGSYNVNSSSGRTMNMDWLLGSNNKFGDFTLDATLGGNVFTNNYHYSNEGVTDFVVPNFYTVENGITKTESYGIGVSQVNSLYGLAELGYKGFLYLNVTSRNDWFSVLTPPAIIVPNPKNSYFYPSASASFIFSELLPKLSWLNFAKLRVAYAKTGSANGVSPYSANLTYGLLSNNFNGLSLGQINNGSSPNPLLKPYGVREDEIGIEAKTLNSRVNFDITYYDKLSTNQIVPIPLSNATGYSSTLVNLGKLKNSGVEFMLELVPVRKADFGWNSSFNVAYNTSEVLALAPGVTRQVVSSFGGNEFIGSLVYQVGKPLNELAAKTYLRNANGQIVVGSNGRLIANSGSNVLFGSGDPKFTGGWSNNFRYKKLSMLVFIDYQFGGKILSSSALNGLRQGNTQASLVGRDGGVIFPAVHADGTPNTTAVDPQTFYTDYRNTQIADPFVFKSDFIKLRNITLNYDFTSVLGKDVKFIKGLVLSAYCQNVLIIKKYIPDLDPEAFASSGDNRVGYEQTALPTTRTFGLNLNVKL